VNGRGVLGLDQKQTVLVLGKFNEAVLERLKPEFDLIHFVDGDGSKLDPSVIPAIKAVIVGIGVKLSNSLVDKLVNLEIISNFGVGYDGIDAAYAAQKNIMVTNTPDVLTEEVADTAVGLLINTVRELPRAQKYLLEGKWEQASYPLSKLSLRERKVGVFGLGRIGKAITRRLEAFDLPISYHNRSKASDVNYTYYPSLLELAKAVDTLILVAPGSPETNHAVNAEVLAALGENGVLINVGRGSLVDEKALIKALQDGVIAAAGLDVFEKEPHVPAELMAMENVVLLPHIASASSQTRLNMSNLVINNLLGWFDNGQVLTSVYETEAVKRSY
jgi:lactate dehydrogenase-like 2-hydroxyacid dehydrogenase